MKLIRSPLVLVAIVAVVLMVGARVNTAIKGDQARRYAIPADVCAQHPTYSCYKTELTDITDAYDPETALALVQKQYQRVDLVRGECHQLTHLIGRAALVKYDNDLGAAYTHGNNFCASGYYHGATEEILSQRGNDYFVNNVNAICVGFSKREYSLDHYNCVHGLGHGFMLAYSDDLYKSLAGCDKLAGDWEQQSCYGGVFMQNIMDAPGGIASNDNVTKYLKVSDLLYPCDSVAQKYRAGCYSIQTEWALPQVGKDYSKVFALCGTIATSSDRKRCYVSLGRDDSGDQNFNDTTVLAVCKLGLRDEAIGRCIDGAAGNYVYNYHSGAQAYHFCSSAEKKYQPSCRQAVRTLVDSF